MERRATSPALLGTNPEQTTITNWYQTARLAAEGIKEVEIVRLVMPDTGFVGDLITHTVSVIAINRILFYEGKQDTPVVSYLTKNILPLYEGLREIFPNTSLRPVERGEGLYSAMKERLSEPQKQQFIFDLRESKISVNKLKKRPLAAPSLYIKPMLYYYKDLSRNMRFRYPADVYGNDRYDTFFRDIFGIVYQEALLEGECQPRVILPADHKERAYKLARRAGVSLDQPQIPIVATSMNPGKRYGRWVEVAQLLSQREGLSDTHFIFILGIEEEEKEQFFQEQYPVIEANPRLKQRVHFAEGSYADLGSYYNGANTNILTAGSDDTGVGWHLMAAVPGDYSIITPCCSFPNFHPRYWQSNGIRQLPVSLDSHPISQDELLFYKKMDRAINEHKPEQISELMYQSILSRRSKPI